MKSVPIKIAVTGGAGQIAYSLLFRIANGEVFGSDQPISLHIIEVPEAVKALEGVKMELEDCAFPLLKEVRIGSDVFELFSHVSYALLIGAKPRGPGMERSDLLRENGKIFVTQGKALDAAADKNVKVLVVGNPCNTNCWIAMKNAPSINPKQFHAMTRLDQNRAQSQLASKAGVSIEEVTRVTIWGNHSATQVPDFVNAHTKGQPVAEVIRDKQWLEKDFVETVQKRGAAVIAARGKSSAASAANAVVDHLKSLVTPTAEGQWFSSGVYTAGNQYGIDPDLIFSFPCRSDGKGNYQVVDKVSWNDDLTQRIKVSEKELIEERNGASNG